MRRDSYDAPCYRCGSYSDDCDCAQEFDALDVLSQLGYGILLVEGEHDATGGLATLAQVLGFGTARRHNYSEGGEY